MKKSSFALPVLTLLAAAVPLVLTPSLALAAGDTHLDGSRLSGIWALPFVGMLLSIALCPLIVPHFWHHHFGKVSAAWALMFLIPCGLSFNWSLTLYTALHTVLLEYTPFIILLFALFTVAGGIRLTGALVGKPHVNLMLLAVGTCLASLMGTTGAAMLLIRPVLRANAHRRCRVHTVVFFIFLVANIGGSLTPLGDPPLFLGFLKGVSFFWTTSHIFPETLSLALTLLAIYFLLDLFLYNREGRPMPDAMGPQESLGLEGKVNLPLLLCVVGLVLMSGLWKSDRVIMVYQDIGWPLPDLVRDVALLAVAGLSLALTHKDTRRGNDFTWEPIVEVAKLFAGIFITMIPAITILRAGEAGALRDLIALVSGPDGQPVNHMYFWLTGGLSSFLDNAPTYLVFFNTAGGDAQHLMHAIPQTLAAISMGAVFMGANTYIGNAPNFMVRSIAVEQGVKMPSFFGYMAWSVGILVPLFILMTFIFLM